MTRRFLADGRSNRKTPLLSQDRFGPDQRTVIYSSGPSNILIEQCFEKTTDQTIAEFVTYSRVHRQAC
jgi:hypothetical protein